MKEACLDTLTHPLRLSIQPGGGRDLRGSCKSLVKVLTEGREVAFKYAINKTDVLSNITV